MWYTSSNDKARDFIRNFRENQQILNADPYTAPTFEPHIVTWSCTNCDQDTKQKDCLSNGRYCAMVGKRSNYINGKDILMEDLREKCLYQIVEKSGQSTDKWWEYMQYVHRMCYDLISEDCSKMGHKQIGFSFEDTMKCVEDSFIPEFSLKPNMQRDDNKILKEEAEKWKAYGSAYWPAIIIN
jgi:hypothetical protein